MLRATRLSRYCAQPTQFAAPLQRYRLSLRRSGAAAGTSMGSRTSIVAGSTRCTKEVRGGESWAGRRDVVLLRGSTLELLSAQETRRLLVHLSVGGVPCRSGRRLGVPAGLAWAWLWNARAWALLPARGAILRATVAIIISISRKTSLTDCVCSLHKATVLQARPARF